MSTNISGKKREALLSKIAEIKTFIEKNADEKNASQLLGYLGELSREVNGKKYGLVFEEHREKIDELLEALRKNENEKRKNAILCVLAVIGAVAAIAGIAYAVYLYL